MDSVESRRRAAALGGVIEILSSSEEGDDDDDVEVVEVVSGRGGGNADPGKSRLLSGSSSSSSSAAFSRGSVVVDLLDSPLRHPMGSLCPPAAPIPLPSYESQVNSAISASNQALKDDQDAEYYKSLAADKMKARMRREKEDKVRKRVGRGFAWGGVCEPAFSR